MNVNRLPVDHGSARQRTTINGSSLASGSAVRHRTIRCGQLNTCFAISTKNQRICCIAQPRRILCNHIQHRLNIRRRAGDHAQDFTRRSLLLQRLLELLNSRTFSMAMTA